MSEDQDRDYRERSRSRDRDNQEDNGGNGGEQFGNQQSEGQSTNLYVRNLSIEVKLILSAL